MKQMVLNLWQDHGKLSMLIQKWIIMQQMKLPTIQKFKNLFWLKRYLLFILVRGEVTVTVAPQAKVAFKNCAPFTKSITKLVEEQWIMLKI